jgi:hypothetical protein
MGGPQRSSRQCVGDVVADSLNPPHEIPSMPTLPFDQDCRASHALRILLFLRRILARQGPARASRHPYVRRRSTDSSLKSRGTNDFQNLLGHAYRQSQGSRSHARELLQQEAGH